MAVVMVAVDTKGVPPAHANAANSTLTRLISDHPLATVGCASLFLLVFVVMLAGRRLQRTRHQRILHQRVERLRLELADADVPAVTRALIRACRQIIELRALLIVMDRGDLPDPALAALRHAVTAAGLQRRLEGLARCRQPVRRGHAAVIAGRLPDPTLIPMLADLIGDRDGDVQRAAIDALAAQRSPGAAAVLLAALRAGRAPADRLVEGLAHPWAAATLADEYCRAENAEVRPWIVEALGLAGESSAHGALVTAATGGSTEERIRACRAFGRLDEPGASSILIDLLDDASGAVRGQAAKALGRHPHPEADLPLRDRLSDQDWWVRAHAAEALRAHGSAGIAQLVAALEDPDRYARDRAAEALALTRAAEGLRVVTQAAEGPPAVTGSVERAPV